MPSKNISQSAHFQPATNGPNFSTYDFLILYNSDATIATIATIATWVRLFCCYLRRNVREAGTYGRAAIPTIHSYTYLCLCMCTLQNWFLDDWVNNACDLPSNYCYAYIKYHVQFILHVCNSFLLCYDAKNKCQKYNKMLKFLK